MYKFEKLRLQDVLNFLCDALHNIDTFYNYSQYLQFKRSNL